MNQFLDIEAEASSEDEVEDDEEDDSFVEDDDDHNQHQDQRVAPFRKQLREEEEEEEDRIFWVSFLNRIRERGQSWRNQMQNTLDGEAEQIWSITVLPGTEQKFARCIRRRLKDPRCPSLNILSPHGDPLIPARVFFKATSILSEAQKTFLHSVAKFKDDSIRQVNSVEFHTLLGHVANTRSGRKFAWVRVQKGTYKGDIGLVYRLRKGGESGLRYDVVVVPRTLIGPTEKTVPVQDSSKRKKLASRPPRSPCSEEEFQRHIGKNIEYLNGLLCFKNRQESWLSWDTAVPSQQDLQYFSRLPNLPQKVLQQALTSISARNLEVGDTVMVIHGDCRGQSGVVRSIDGDTTDIFLFDHNLNRLFSLNEVRKHFRVGDCVQVIEGQEKGFKGWIVQVNEEDHEIHVLDHYTMTMKPIALEFLAFHSADFVMKDMTVIEPLSVEEARDEKMMKATMRFDPYKYLVGKNVVVAEKGYYKGYVGIVKEICHDGTAWVELSAVARRQRIPLTTLREITEAYSSELEIGLVAGKVPLSEFGPSTKAPVPVPAPPPPPTALGFETPRWNPEDHDGPASSTSPTWNPSLPDPFGVPHWLGSIAKIWMDDDRYPSPKRICLRLLGLNAFPELKQYEDKQCFFESGHLDRRDETIAVQMKSGPEIVRLPIDRVTHVHPSVKGQYVLAFEGEHEGKTFKVIAMEGEVASLSPSWMKKALPPAKRISIKKLSLVVLQ
ncbi:hypothetical protein MD484_g7908, partial [Candolleomyces efflorescens]